MVKALNELLKFSTNFEVQGWHFSKSHREREREWQPCVVHSKFDQKIVWWKFHENCTTGTTPKTHPIIPTPYYSFHNWSWADRAWGQKKFKKIWYFCCVLGGGPFFDSFRLWLTGAAHPGAQLEIIDEYTKIFYLLSERYVWKFKLCEESWTTGRRLWWLC